MEGDDLFLNFKPKKETAIDKEKDFLGKKRNNDKPSENNLLQENRRQKLDNTNLGQNLNSENNLKSEKNNNIQNDSNMNDIIEINNIENLKKEKEYLKNQILKVYPEIDNELKLLKNIPKNENENNNNKINKKNISQLKEELNIKKEMNTPQTSNSNQIPETTKLTFDYQQEKEKYDNLIEDKDIIINKEDFTGGYHENIRLKSTPYDDSKKIKKYIDIQNLAYKFNFKLDEFQEKGILCLENRESVLVSAHTSAGKTVVAQYAIAMAKRDHQRVIYTSPIKALSNQKYRDLKEVFEDVGLMTGDVTRNENASCIVMTTEILRNMLFKGSEITKEIAWVIFDEVHYMRDRERGVVWEETIILLSNKINYVFLSATIPNAREFGMWITKLKKQPCNVVYTSFRPTPLKHYIFPVEMNNSKLYLVLDSKNTNSKGNKKNVEEIFHDRNYGMAFDILQESQKMENCSQKNKKNKKNESKMGLIKLIKCLYRNKFCPVIVFAFSKRECESNAIDLYKYNPLQKNKFDKNNLNINREETENCIDFNTEEEKNNIEKIYYNAINKLSKEDQELPNIVNFLPLLKRGIGVHHGGMLPILKECVELMFQEGLIKVLFSTETFSMGINMPAKTVVFTSLKKFDGEFQRYLGGGEYTQMAGRAGRRGIDQEGNVIVMIDKHIDKNECEKIIKGKSAPLISSFQLSYNQLANLIRIEGLEPSHILSQSFRQFQKEKSVPILKTKLAKLYNDYLSKNFENEEKENEVKQLYDIDETLKKLKKDYRTKIFIPKNITKYLCLGRIIKLLYFGYGLVINCKMASEIKINNKDNMNIITEYASKKTKEKEENILEYNEEDLYLKNIGIEDEDSSNLENKELDAYKKLLKNKDFVTNSISNTTQNKIDENNADTDTNKDNNKGEINNNEENNVNEIVVDVLVSLKQHADVNGCLTPGNFEDNNKTFFGIVPFTITMIENIYEVRAKMIVDLKDPKLIEDYGKRLKEIINRFKDNLPVLDIIKKNNITTPSIIKLSNDIYDLEKKYNNMKDNYEKKYGKENNILEKDLNKYIERNKIQKNIKKVISKIESSKNLVLNEELINMQRVMRRLDFVTKDEILTQKGQIICDISGADELLTGELLFSGFFKDLTLEEIGAAIYCCLSKETGGKKEEESSLNKDKLAQKSTEKIFEAIQKKAEYIGEILEECKMLGKDGKEKYIESFNDNYMLPMYKWINGISFSDLIKEYYSLYEGSIIRVIRRVEEFSKNFVLCAQHIGDNNLQNKLQELENKIKRGLPFTASLYLA